MSNANPLPFFNFSLLSALQVLINVYYFWQDGSTMSATQRAYHPEELAKQTNLKIGKKQELLKKNISSCVTSTS